jgi:hypothetical protein
MFIMNEDAFSPLDTMTIAWQKQTEVKRGSCVLPLYFSVHQQECAASESASFATNAALYNHKAEAY